MVLCFIALVAERRQGAKSRVTLLPRLLLPEAFRRLTLGSSTAARHQYT